MGIEGLNTLLSQTRGHLPPELCIAVSDPTQEAGPLFPVEEAAVARAIVERRNEFAAGRRAARQALAEFGLPELPIPVSEDRAPVWPAGISGSISHTHNACLAVVVPEKTMRSVGVDLETDTAVATDMIFEICSRPELAFFPEPAAQAAMRIFSAKEAAYKAQFPISRTLFGFETLTVADADATIIRLRFARPVPPFAKGQDIAVHQWTGHGYVLSLAIIPRKR